MTAAPGLSVRPARGRQEWDQLFATVERPHMTQAWAYGEAKQAEGGISRLARNLSVRRLVIERRSEPLAICQVVDKTAAGLCVASRLSRGPLLLGDGLRDDVTRDVYLTLRRRWSSLRHGALLLGPALETDDQTTYLLRELGFRPRRAPGWASSVLDLRLDESELRARLSPAWRNRLKAAERSPLILRISGAQASLDWLLARHVDNMRDKRFVGPPKPFVDALCRLSQGSWFVSEARLEGEPDPVAGMLVWLFGNTAEYSIGWFGEVGKKMGVSNFLYWNSVIEAKRRGCSRFDLGGYSVREEYGLRHFKQGMRGAHYELMNEWICY